MWETANSIKEVREIRSKTTVYLGVGAIKKIKDIAQNLKNTGVGKVIVVSGKGSYKTTGAWDYVNAAFNETGIGYVIYDKVSPNPTTDQADEAAKMGKDFGAQAVVAIGGGSPIDAGKSVAILLAYPEKSARDLCTFEFAPEKALPIIAINLTHGTGTEANRFAVLTIPELEYKPAIAYDCIYPTYSIDDPELTVKLPVRQTLYVSIDAVNHVIEASTTKVANPYTIMLAKEVIRLVVKYLPQAVENPEDLTARYYLLYASMVAGICFDNGLLHFTHALEHPLSAVKPELAHGLGLSILLPAVAKEIYPAKAEVLADILAPIVPNLSGNKEEAEAVYAGIRNWLNSVGVKSTLKDEGFTESQLSKLTDLAFTTPSLSSLLSVAPIEADRKTVENIFRNSL